MDNQFDVGLQEDYDNMTTDLGRFCTLYKRDDVMSYEGQEGMESGLKYGKKEVIFLQELDTEHEMVAAGQLQVGDVKFNFLSNSEVEEEDIVSPNEGITFYKVLKLTKIKNQSNDVVMYIKAFGKKLPGR